jgi:hypothetical protein
MNMAEPSWFAQPSWFITAVAGLIGWFLALRKDERATQIEQITTERTKWRTEIRCLLKDIAESYTDISGTKNTKPEMVVVNRAKLVASLNPHDVNDNKIIEHYDLLFKGDKVDFNVFANRIAILLKHDWERVKWECVPIYGKLLYWCSMPVYLDGKRCCPLKSGGTWGRPWKNPVYRKLDND